MLYSLRFKEAWRCFKEGDTIEFRPGVNLLVGDQGTGKSSVLQALGAAGGLKSHSHQKDLAKKVALICTPIACYGFDFEKDNKRTLSYFDGDIRFQVASMFSSHGQTNLAIVRGLERADKSLVMFDEPDTALSIRSITELASLFKKAAEKGCQIVASVHHPFLIWAFPEVYSLEHRKWMTSKDFVRTQTESNDVGTDNPKTT